MWQLSFICLIPCVSNVSTFDPVSLNFLTYHILYFRFKCCKSDSTIDAPVKEDTMEEMATDIASDEKLEEEPKMEEQAPEPTPEEEEPKEEEPKEEETVMDAPAEDDAEEQAIKQSYKCCGL